MKKNRILLLTLLLTSCMSKAQIDQDILKVLRSRLLNIDVYELIFSENELIDLCQDTTGRNLVTKHLSNLNMSIPSMDINRGRTELIALNLLLKRINASKPSNKNQKESKEFLERQLKNFNYDFNVDEKLALDLFDHKKRDLSRKEACDIGISMYVIFLYDPLLYLKVVKGDAKVNSKEVFFPLKCTITEYDRSFSIRKRMQASLLDMLKDHKGNNDLNKIYKDISNAIIDGSND